LADNSALRAEILLTRYIQIVILYYQYVLKVISKSYSPDGHWDGVSRRATTQYGRYRAGEDLARDNLFSQREIGYFEMGCNNIAFGRDRDKKRLPIFVNKTLPSSWLGRMLTS
jgi:hypothetical protein